MGQGFSVIDSLNTEPLITDTPIYKHQTLTPAPRHLTPGVLWEAKKMFNP